MAVDMDKLHPRLKKLAEELQTACERKGLPIRYTQGYRSKEEQDALYAQGRTKPGNIVTNAKGGYSMHNWGVAIDFCRNDDKGVYEDSDGFFSKVGSIGKKLGLEWGGDWKSIKDKPHFQLPDWGSGSATLRSRYGTFEAFKKTWCENYKQDSKSSKNNASGGKVTGEKTTKQVEPEDIKMTTIKKGSRGKAVCVWQTVLGLTKTNVDGIFGDTTLSKTKAFQKRHGLKQDGIVGDNTWKVGLESV